TNNSFAGLFLFAVGSFQSFLAKGCALLHLAMALWRVYFERGIEILRQVVGDILLAQSWVFFLVYSWR
ncbi:hypothetical protein CFOL_v3_13909, partial [Cephalotus follicularis]